MPFCGTGVRHGLDHVVLGLESRQRSWLNARTSRYLAANWSLADPLVRWLLWRAVVVFFNCCFHSVNPPRPSSRNRDGETCARWPVRQVRGDLETSDRYK